MGFYLNLIHCSMKVRSEMMNIQQALTIPVVTVNWPLMIWAFFKHNLVADVGTFLTGSCTSISRLDSGIHLLLGAGNYCMQILVAPSREEVNAAQMTRKPLYIGIPISVVARLRVSILGLRVLLSSHLSIHW